MTSTRLPGKVLKTVLGRPLLEYQLERLRRATGINRIIVATTTNVEDDQIVDFCAQQRVPVFRGLEQDVLDRYYQTALRFSIDPIVRITGDCPLIDPQIVDRLVTTFQNGAYDFVHSGPTFAEGLDCEIFTLAALERAWKEAIKPSEREHATLYLHRHSEFFRKHTLDNGSDDSRFRITVDEPEDFEVVKIIIEALYPRHPEFTGEDVLQYLSAHPEMMATNSHIVRNEGLLKSLSAEKGSS